MGKIKFIQRIHAIFRHLTLTVKFTSGGIFLTSHSSCTRDNIFFSIRAVGKSWVRMGTFSLLNLDKKYRITAKIIRKTDPYFFSMNPKFDHWIFVDLHDLYKLWTWNCSANSTNQNENIFMFTTCTKHVNQQRINCQILA